MLLFIITNIIDIMIIVLLWLCSNVAISIIISYIVDVMIMMMMTIIIIIIIIFYHYYKTPLRRLRNKLGAVCVGFYRLRGEIAISQNCLKGQNVNVATGQTL